MHLSGQREECMQVLVHVAVEPWEMVNPHLLTPLNPSKRVDLKVGPEN